MPTMAPISICRPWRRILIIRSVPMLPLPMMAAFSLRSATGCLLLCGDALGNAAHAPMRGRHFLQDHANGFARCSGGFDSSVSQPADQGCLCFGTAALYQGDLDQWHVSLISVVLNSTRPRPCISSAIC